MPDAARPSPSDIPVEILKRLVSPGTHRPLRVEASELSSDDPEFKGSIRDGVAVMTATAQRTFFDDKFEVMQRGHERPGEWAFCYQQQTALLSSYLRPGQVLLDVGCGPTLPYRRPPGVYTIGLEPSFESIRANGMVDLRVCASATAIPMADASVDLVVCFYAIHHMVGGNLEETGRNVARAFQEFGRVLRPGGLLFVFEMTPAAIFGLLQNSLWNSVRRLIPDKLDMYFWSARALTTLADRCLPAGSVAEKIFFGASPFTLIPPIFSLPWFQVPRFVYPLDAKLYKWRMPEA